MTTNKKVWTMDKKDWQQEEEEEQDGSDDLHDLLDKNNNSNGGENSEMKPLNLDQLSAGDLDVEVTRNRKNSGHNCLLTLVQLLCAYCAYACEYAPKCCLGIGLLGLLIPSYLIIMAVTNPTEQFGVIAHDYTEIQSQYDLSIGNIDHWCLKGDNDSCRCDDPLQPQARGEFRAWTKSHQENLKTVQKVVERSDVVTPDIAFLGASAVEEMDGRWFGSTDDPMLKSLATMFNNNFNKKNGAALEAVTLGIAGDTNPSVLWRIMNGEMPEEFNPKLWWLELGLNDLGRAQCSEEVVVLGILRVVEEIINRKPGVPIVINSLFPMADLRGGAQPQKADFKDFSTKPHNMNDARRPRNNNNNNNNNRPQRAGRNNNKVKKAKKRARENDDDEEVDGEDSGGFRRQLQLEWTSTYEKPSRLTKESRVRGDVLNNKPKEREAWSFGGGGGPKESARIRGNNNNNNKKQVKMDGNKKEQKKYAPMTHRQRVLPLWTSIIAINRELRKFCEKHSNVFFFDVTDIFTERIDGDYWALKTDMISLRGHPSLKGYEAWEKAVIAKAKEIL